jgi:hypothetical protein
MLLIALYCTTLQCNTALHSTPLILDCRLLHSTALRLHHPLLTALVHYTLLHYTLQHCTPIPVEPFTEAPESFSQALSASSGAYTGLLDIQGSNTSRLQTSEVKHAEGTHENSAEEFTDVAPWWADLERDGACVGVGWGWSGRGGGSWCWVWDCFENTARAKRGRLALLLYYARWICTLTFLRMSSHCVILFTCTLQTCCNV